MEEFIAEHYDEIMEGINEYYPQYVPNDDVILDDIPEWIVEEFITKHMGGGQD